jgi:hypothetical protein
MAKLIYSAITSLDGYVEDVEGRFDWAAPVDEVHAFVNNLERTVGIYLSQPAGVVLPRESTRLRPASRSHGSCPFVTWAAPGLRLLLWPSPELMQKSRHGRGAMLAQWEQ